MSRQTDQITVAYHRNAKYDHLKKKFSSLFGVVTTASNGKRHFGHHFETNAVLSDVRFTSNPGFDDGCQETGVLGFATGVLVSEDNDPKVPMKQAIAVKFNGHHFVRQDTMKKVDRANYLLLTARGVYAEFTTSEKKAPKKAPYIPTFCGAIGDPVSLG